MRFDPHFELLAFRQYLQVYKRKFHQFCLPTFCEQHLDIVAQYANIPLDLAQFELLHPLLFLFYIYEIKFVVCLSAQKY
jgi:hypothetical protein